MNCIDWANRHLREVESSFRVREVDAVTIADEPITLAQAWAHLRLDPDGSPPATPDDPWLTDIGIPAARAWAEDYCGITIASKLLELAGNQFPDGSLQLPLGPVRELVSITYLDADGVEQVLDLADVVVNPYAPVPTVTPATAWPEAKQQDRSIIVLYRAGYSSESPPLALRPNLRIGMLLLLGHMFEHREDVAPSNLAALPMGAKSFLDASRVRLGFA